MIKNRVLSSNWVVTLTATLIGVFLAMYLNEVLSSNKLNNQKSIATENILFEIEENKKSLEDNIEKHKALAEIFEFMKTYMDEDNRLIAEVDSMQIIKAKYSDVFTVKDSTLVENEKYHYKGTMNVNFTVSYINLSNLAWKTFKNSNLTTEYDFNCLMLLERLDKITEETLTKERKVLEMMQNPEDYEKESYNVKLNHLLDILISSEEGLIEGYVHSKEKLKNCE